MKLSGTSWADRLRLERELSAILHDLQGPAVQEITFRKQSHNAVVYSGRQQDQRVFVKRYQTDYGSVLTRNTVEETSIVLQHMAAGPDGIAETLWASDAAGIVVMAEAPGRPVVDALAEEGCEPVMRQTARWFKSYIGPRHYDDLFSTSYWVRQRSDVDLSMMTDVDRELAQNLLALQRRRMASNGTIPAVKGRVPKDFAPHNLHWTGDAIFGFDLEGYSHQPLVKAALWFVVLASKRVENPKERLFGLPSECVQPFMDVMQDQANDERLWPYLAADLIFYRFQHRYADVKIRVSLRMAIESHLATA